MYVIFHILGGGTVTSACVNRKFFAGANCKTVGLVVTLLAEAFVRLELERALTISCIYWTSILRCLLVQSLFGGRDHVFAVGGVDVGSVVLHRHDVVVALNVYAIEVHT